MVDFAFYATEDFYNVARIQDDNYDARLYKENRIKKIDLVNPLDHHVLENFGLSRKKSKPHATIRSDVFYNLNPTNEMLMTRTGSIPYSCSGIESNYVLSDKLHHLDPTTLTFQNPKLTL